MNTGWRRTTASIALAGASLLVVPADPAGAFQQAPAATPPAPDQPNVDAALRARIDQGGLAFGVPLSVAVARRQGATADQVQLGFEASVPVATTRPLTVLFGIVDKTGRVINAGKRAVTAAATSDEGRLTFTVPLAAGVYRLRVAVADAAGNIGSTETEVAAYLTQAGVVRISDVLTAWSGADGQFRFLGLDDPPSSAKVVRASIEIYPDAAQPAQALMVHFSLLREHETKPAFDQDATPTGPGGTLAATVTLPWGKVPEGLYALRADVRSGSTVLGSATRSLRVF